MVGTRRSSRMVSQPTSAQIDRQRVKRHKSMPLNLRSHPPTIEVSAATLFEHCIERMLPHIWYKIIPFSADDVNTITFAMGQSWENIFELLLCLNYIKKFGKNIST